MYTAWQTETCIETFPVMDPDDSKGGGGGIKAEGAGSEGKG